MGGGTANPIAGLFNGKGKALNRGKQVNSNNKVPVGVGVNALRATLGVRPLPVPVAGAVRGVLHCTGAMCYLSASLH